ncbi:MAG: hypothetical protein U9R27_07550 [Campylobacterota bacterium]|nr:hypothetical protein [Campylobacterota bacterium]
MQKNSLVFLAIGIVLVSILLSFFLRIGDIDENDIAIGDKSYHQKNIIGQTILVFSGGTFQRKFLVWKRSPLHQDFLDHFPNFEEMKAFIQDRIDDPAFQRKLTAHIDKIEGAYFSGAISDVDAKEMIDDFKEFD